MTVFLVELFKVEMLKRMESTEEKKNEACAQTSSLCFMRTQIEAVVFRDLPL